MKSETEISVTPSKLRTDIFESIYDCVNTHSVKHLSWGGVPLILDVQTANLLKTVYEALSQVNKDKFKRSIQKSRQSFVTVVDFCWKTVS